MREDGAAQVQGVAGVGGHERLHPGDRLPGMVECLFRLAGAGERLGEFVVGRRHVEAGLDSVLHI